jgi:DNA-directed RNA polymerase specialized sigma24 family protein
MTPIDRLFERARGGDTGAFAGWMGSVELPIRRRLQRFAQAVDVEAILPETFLRMWILARDRGRELTGENASFRFALGLARNLAREEARRLGRERLLPPGELPEPPVDPDPVPDPALRRAILDCIGELSKRPLSALRARLASGAVLPDREIARRVGMTLNTFLQNIVRARKQVAECLGRKGVVLAEVLS